MKKQYRFSLIVIIFSILFIGCDSWIEGYDDDPNSSPEVSIDNLFTASQVNMFNFSENHLARSVSIWMQHMAGTDRQYKTLGLYTFEENDYSSSWQSVYINGGLKDLRKIQTIADEVGPNGVRYKGIAQFMEAYLIGMAASVWGDIPYSQVLNESIDDPGLDEQDSVYASVQALLDSAIQNLEGWRKSDTTLIPQNDMFYNGDIDKWKATAYTLKARYYMHWVETDISYCDSALTNAENGISSLDGTLKTLHGIESSEQNIWFQFEQDRFGYMVAGSNLVQLLKNNNDPRDSIYFGDNNAGSIVGANPNGNSQGKSYLNDEYFGSDAAIDIVSYEENLLIKAECHFLRDEISKAQQAIQDAQTVVEEKWGFEENTFPDISLTGIALIDKIIEEKYIALFLNIELWNDYKRNCYSDFYSDINYEKSIDSMTGEIIYEYPPRRVYYPEDERITNTSIPNITSQPLYNDNDPNGCH
jgi:hypothetical protein